MTQDDPFAAPESRDPYLGMSNDGWLAVAFALLLVPAASFGGLSALTGLVGLAGLVVDIPTEPGDPPIAVMGLVECAVFTVPTLLYSAAALGVFTRQKWGWVTALIGFALWMGGCCMPFALVGFYALLREQGRKAFGF